MTPKAAAWCWCSGIDDDDDDDDRCHTAPQRRALIFLQGGDLARARDSPASRQGSTLIKYIFTAQVS